MHVPDAAFSSTANVIRFRHVSRVLIRGAPIALAVTIIATAATFLISRQLSPTYEASATLLISNPPRAFGGLELVAPPQVDPRVYQRAVLEGPIIHNALQGVDGLDLNGPDLLNFKKRVSVSVEDHQFVSGIVRITVRAGDSSSAALYANSIAQELIEWDIERGRQAVDNAFASMDRALTLLQAEISAAAAAGDQVLAQELQRTGEALSSQLATGQEAVRTRSSSSVAVSLLDTLSDATPPPDAVGPRVAFNSALAALLAVLLSYGLQLTRWTLRNRVGTAEALTGLTGMPNLVELPYQRNSRRPPQELLGYLRANITHARVGERPRVIGITSPSGLGDSAGVAVGLGESFARAGRRALVIDANMREPGITGAIDIRNSTATELATYLKSPDIEADPLTIVVGGRISFDFIPSTTPLALADTLLERGMSPLLGRLWDKYDIIIIDLPGLLAFPDALAVSKACSFLILCASSATRATDVTLSVELLSRNKVAVLGTVLTNGSRTRSLHKNRRPMREPSVATGSPRVDATATIDGTRKPVVRVQQRSKR